MATIVDSPKDVFQTPIHPAALLFPELPADELKDLAADIKKNGLLEPIVVTNLGPEGQVIDGRNRLKACKLAGVKPDFTTFAASGLRPDFDPFDYVLSANLKRRHLTPAQRREVIAAVIKQRPEKSNRHVAKQTKTDHKTVERVRKELEHGGEIPHHAERVGRDGVKQPAKKTASANGAPKRSTKQATKATSAPKVEDNEGVRDIEGAYLAARKVFDKLQPTLRSLQSLMGCDRATFAPSVIAGHARQVEREVKNLFAILTGDPRMAKSSKLDQPATHDFNSGVHRILESWASLDSARRCRAIDFLKKLAEEASELRQA
jgi:hypothetical protein